MRRKEAERMEGKEVRYSIETRDEPSRGKLSVKKEENRKKHREEVR